MRFLSLLLLLSCTAAWAQNPFPNFRQVNPNATDGYYFQGNDQLRFIISRQRFATHEEAAAFCSTHFLPMANEMVVAVLAMVGAEQNRAVRESLLFRFTKNGKTTSGVWAWTKDKQRAFIRGRVVMNDVMVWADGSGEDVQYGSFAEMRGALAEFNITGLPAVCGSLPDVPPNGDPSVNDTYRGAPRGNRDSGGPAQYLPGATST